MRSVMKRILFFGLLALALFPVAVRATSDTYENDGTVLSPPDVAPQIDATNFVNTGSFTVDLPLTLTAEQYKTANTVNYTNTGTMSAEWGFDLETFPGPKMAASFYNSGTINGGFLAGSSIIISGVGLSVRMIVSATNISNPGNINMGSDSLLKLTGQSLDLSRSILTTAGGSTVSTLDYGVGQCPLSNTVVFPFLAWDPSVYLGQNYAYSSIFTNHLRQQLQEVLFNSTPYSAIQSVNISNVITRAIFLQNNNPAVTTRVFIEPNDLGGGYGHVEWAGSYIDTATDLQFTNYFYLSDIFVRTTNATSIPDVFSFMQNNGTPLFLGVATPTGMPAFDPGNVTNLYSYVSVLAIPGTADTNSVVGGNVTNLPGRIQISASRDLDLTLAQISGPNYLLLESTNQFKGNNGSTISASYGDIRLGVTNGFLTISNLWKPTIPVWNGPIQAWNTRWFTITTNLAITFTTNVDFTVTTNSVGFSVTNDYRVLLVDSTLVPIAPTYVQDLVLHATNTLTISDTFNILRTLSIDAQSLTLTTNAYGHGANSADGELNLLSSSLSWAASAPRLRWLTNNAAIRLQNLLPQSFGSALPGGNYLAWINNGLISDAGSTIWVDNFQKNGTILNDSGSF